MRFTYFKLFRSLQLLHDLKNMLIFESINTVFLARQPPDVQRRNRIYMINGTVSMRRKFPLSESEKKDNFQTCEHITTVNTVSQQCKLTSYSFNRSMKLLQEM